LEQQPDPALERFFAALLEWAGVERPARVSGSAVEVRLLESGRERIAGIFHHAAVAAEAEIVLALGEGPWQATDLETGAPVAFEDRGPHVRLKKRFDPQETWIVRFVPAAR
jgi:hypothetical protein